ncbi:SDR family oxidoreductase [Shinella sp. 838]|uniref:SDR family oxidoreductase n=1 Tax=Shinella sp. 838 TaxID=3038164 RepID=UPI002414E52D|nr:SDR family oxidoreductase [Shinella sp. 838]MDG4674846.1 SDR family oxidoreductase [Shinella sp. 838]
MTAAGQGIGRAVAERLARDGADVSACDLSASALADLTAARTTVLDATNSEAFGNWVASFQRIDILVHAVGFVHQGTIEECGPEDWRRSLNITLDSAYIALKAVIPKMKNHGGSVITIASVASSIKGFPRRAAYGAAKGGVIGLTKACAADYLRENIRFNAICPGTVDSPSLRSRMADLADSVGGMAAAEKLFLDRQPAGRLGTPEEIAALCAFLASDEASFVNGQTINIDGGITI